MGLFRKSKSGYTQLLIAERIVQGILWIQRRWVAFMQRMERRCSVMQKKIFLVLFCIASVAVFGFTLLNAIAGKAVPVQDFSPSLRIQKGSPRVQDFRAPRLNKTDSLNIGRFLNLIDSLGKTAEGSEQVRQYFQRYPGMRERLNQFRDQQ